MEEDRLRRGIKGVRTLLKRGRKRHQVRDSKGMAEKGSEKDLLSEGRQSPPESAHLHGVNMQS